MGEQLGAGFLNSMIEHFGMREAGIGVFAAFAVYVLWSMLLTWLKHRRGDEVEYSFLGWKHKSVPSREIARLETALKKLGDEYDKINKDLKHKTDILLYLDQAGQLSHKLIVETADITDWHEYDKQFHLTVDAILHLIAHSVRNGKDGISRIGIFVSDETETYLSLLKGLGYSASAHNGLKLDIETSFAGAAYRTKKIRRSGDISKEREFQHLVGQHKYASLICAPVLFAYEADPDGPVGVLNIDAEHIDSFDEFDERIVTFFANQLALLLMAYKIKLSMKPATTIVETAATQQKGVGTNGETAEATGQS